MNNSDTLQRFLIDSAHSRGHYVHLDTAWQEACERIDYPEPVRTALGEAFGAAVLLSAIIKFEGRLTLQVRGPGPVHLLVIQVTSNGQMRGLARWTDLPESQTLAALFGEEAQMSISIETGRGQPYQGIVSLEGDDLIDAIKGYFENSEQLPTELYVAVSESSVAGMLLQKLPSDDAEDDDWNRVMHLASTVTPHELLSLTSESLLHRLFHQETVRLFTANDVAFNCSCSRERTSSMIRGLGQAEADDIIREEGKIEVICEFCAAEYRYDAVDVASLFADSASLAPEEDLPVH